MKKQTVLLAVAAFTLAACNEKETKTETSMQSTEQVQQQSQPMQMQEKQAQSKEQMQEQKALTTARQSEQVTHEVAPAPATEKEAKEIAPEMIENAVAEVGNQDISDFIQLSGIQAEFDQKLLSLQGEVANVLSANKEQQKATIEKVNKTLDEVENSIKNIKISSTTVNDIRDKILQVSEQTKSLFSLAVELNSADDKTLEAQAQNVQNKVETLQKTTLDLQSLQQQFIMSHKDELQKLRNTNPTVDSYFH